jgi:thiol-disulfide isomerase/thioredoxin
LILAGLSTAGEDSPLVKAAQAGRNPKRFVEYSRLKPGMPAPAVVAARWYNARDTASRRPLLLAFWATSCGRCVTAMPRLQEIDVRRRAELDVITVHPAAGATGLPELIRRGDFTLPVAIDDGRIRKAYGITGVPTYFLIDGAGIVRTKTHTPPKDADLDLMLTGRSREQPAALTRAATRATLLRKSIAIRPIETQKPFGELVSRHWINSAPLRLADLRPRAVLVDFWATWCMPCVESLPTLKDYAERFPDRLVVVGVHYAAAVDEVRRFAARNRLLFPIAVDADKAMWEKFSISYVPTYVLLDGKGVVRYVGTSPPTLAELAPVIAE